MTGAFDMFLLREAVIRTSNTVTIDGTENKEFYGSDPDLQALESLYEHSPWGKMRPFIASLIKGKYTPLSMHIVLYLNPELQDNLLGDTGSCVDHLVLTVRFEAGRLNLTTGVAYSEFTLDKDAERLWDEYVSSRIAQ